VTDADSTLQPVPDALLAPRPDAQDRLGGLSAPDPAALNRTHDMAGLRARGGLVVRSIEDRRRALVAARVARCGGGVAIDVGCEDGWIASAYADRMTQTVLVDVDPAMLERARARAIPRARTLVADAAAVGAVPPASADVVVLSAILEHVADPRAVLGAWAAALRPGGRFVVYVPADRPILALKRALRVTHLARLVRGISLEPAPGHVRVFSRRALVRLLRPFGVLEELEFDPVCLGYAATVRVPAATDGS